MKAERKAGKEPTSWKHQAQLGCTARHCLHVLAPLVVHTLEPGTNTRVTYLEEVMHLALYGDEWLTSLLFTDQSYLCCVNKGFFLLFFFCFT